MITIATHLSEIQSAASQYRVRLLKELAIHYPEAHVIFILDSEKIKLPSLPPNCTLNLTGPRIRNSLLKKYYYDFKIPPILLRYNVSVFIPDGEIVSRAKVIQYWIDNNFRLNKPFPKTLSGIITPDDGRVEILQKHFNNVIAVLPGAESFMAPIIYDDKAKIMDEVSGGNEFYLTFLNKSSVKSFYSIVKAYSIFRKWQKSTMKMILVCDGSVQEELRVKLSSYKYREDILLREPVMLNTLLPAAYAFINTSAQPYHILDAIAGNIPVISIHRGFEDAVLFAADDETSISEKMMVLYKDEAVRLQLIGSARSILEKYNWSNNIRRMMAVLDQ